MIRLGVIGTNWITDRFLDAAHQTGELKLTAVYSRTEEKAKQFADKYEVETIFTRLSDFFESDAFDAVYIASPTALHATQAIQAMENKKHVLVEKPMASNVREAEKMFAVAEKEEVVLMEAMKTTHLPNFDLVKDLIEEIKPVRRVIANFCQYSSRYDRYKEGEVLNAFKPELSNGSLMDIGIYTVYPIIKLFGRPNKIQASAMVLESGVDGSGTVLLSYDELEANMIFSKITNSALPSEIQGENGSIVIDKWSDMSGIHLVDKAGHKEERSLEQLTNSMGYEARHFAELIKTGQTESDINTFDTSLQTMKVLDEARRQIGVVYPADEK